MCDENCIAWGLENISLEEIQNKRILEVGSLNVNGSLREGIDRLKPSSYVGIDIKSGPCVDQVCNAEDLISVFGNESFDFVLSTCTLEHVENWKLCISNIKRVCRRGGYILIIVPSMWPIHEYPHDYWRFNKSDMFRIFKDCEIIKLDHDYEIDGNNDPLSLVYLKCRKPKFFIEANLEGYVIYGVKKE